MREKIKNSWITNVLFTLLAAWVAYGAYRMTSQMVFLWGEARTREQKIEELENEKRELESSIAELQSRSAVEREAKKRLNLKLPGEEVMVVLPEKKEAATSTPSFLERAKEFLRTLVK